jgi:hypothetical protein
MIGWRPVAVNTHYTYSQVLVSLTGTVSCVYASTLYVDRINSKENGLSWHRARICCRYIVYDVFSI